MVRYNGHCVYTLLLVTLTIIYRSSFFLQHIKKHLIFNFSCVSTFPRVVDWWNFFQLCCIVVVVSFDQRQPLSVTDNGCGMSATCLLLLLFASELLCIVRLYCVVGICMSASVCELGYSKIDCLLLLFGLICCEFCRVIFLLFDSFFKCGVQFSFATLPGGRPLSNGNTASRT